jgi:ABC-type multidrug transport system fused ATPase/permease subunit
MEGRTTLNVTHKLEQFYLQKVLVLEAGSVVEEGTCEELTAKKEYFYRLLHGLE